MSTLLTCFQQGYDISTQSFQKELVKHVPTEMKIKPHFGPKPMAVKLLHQLQIGISHAPLPEKENILITLKIGKPKIGMRSSLCFWCNKERETRNNRDNSKVVALVVTQTTRQSIRRKLPCYVASGNLPHKGVPELLITLKMCGD